MHNSPSFMTLLLTLAAALPPIGSAFAFPSLASHTTTSSIPRHHRPNRDLVGHEHKYSTRHHYFPPTHLSSSSSGNDDANKVADTINIAIVASANTAPLDTTAFREALASHPFCQMTGMQLSIVDILLPHNNINNINNINNEDDKQSRNESTTSLQSSDIACFPTSSTVKSYLRFVDSQLNLSNDITEEERRRLPNRPPTKDASTDDDDDDVGPATSLETTGIMAACIDTETAKQCLNSGRWSANHIYYPKSGEAVDLKIEEGSDGNDDDDKVDDDDVVENEEWTEEMIDLWIASVMQAAGDVMERKFWGGGW
mmetsp:Transcript_14985/g.31699  ORF Transcript_14985/g.31699 Transcript_14985/m.31699 type:complete len:313 (-) Transcript_14985:56-994(-)